MKILNLYSGIGGNRKLWGDEHEVWAVESFGYIADAYKQLFPKDVVLKEDAHQYLLDFMEKFDFIWSSPPCPTHSRMVTAKRGWGIKEYPDMRLYEEIIYLQKFCKVPWVVENVIPYYEPLIKPTVVIDRHMFWSNFDISPLDIETRNFSVTDANKETLAISHGIKLPDGTKNQRKLLRNAVRPEVGLHILKEAGL
jgi:DNA (cytosine-5)-methyltransferase 1